MLTPHTMKLIVEILEFEEFSLEEILQLDMINTVGISALISLDLRQSLIFLAERAGLVPGGSAQNAAFRAAENDGGFVDEWDRSPGCHFAGGTADYG